MPELTLVRPDQPDTLAALVPALALAGICKRFGGLEVLKGVDVAIPAGRVTALVGPNAAGKSTLIKSILGLVHPDAGTIRVAGISLDGRSSYRAGIGYMPQHANFPENLSGREILQLVSGLRGQADTDRSLVSRFSLEPALDQRIRTLSGGTRQKLNAVIAFLFTAPLLILDEPSAGLDPVANGILKDLIREARNAGRAVLIASHIMSELEETAEDLVVLIDGRVRYHGPIEALRSRSGESTLERAVASLLLREN